METSRESERQAWRPLDTLACSLDASTSSSCSLFGWDPQLFYFGQAAAGIGARGFGADEIHNHELELIVHPKCRRRAPPAARCLLVFHFSLISRT
jgi:hypothetical protein